MLFSEHEEQRKTSRTGISNSVRLQPIGLEEVIGSLSQDISQTGLRLIVNDFIPINSKLNMNVELSPNQFVECLGRVMWISQVPHSDRYEIGIKFEWFAPGHEAKNRIERHVAETSDQNK